MNFHLSNEMNSHLSDDDLLNYFRDDLPRIRLAHARLLTMVERAIGALFVELVYAGRRLDEAKGGSQAACEATVEFEDLAVDKQNLLRELAILADINFNDAAHQQGVAMLRELNPNHSYEELSQMIEGYLDVCPTTTQEAHTANKKPAHDKFKLSSLLH